MRSNVDGAGRMVSFGRWPTPDGVTFMSEGTTVAALARFEATLESLGEMQKAGWLQLEVADDKKRRRGRHRQTMRGAAAPPARPPCTAPRLLGE